MNKIIPFAFEDQLIRVIERDGEPWFVAADVCRALDIKNVSQAVERLADDEKGVCSTDTLGGKQDALAVSEAGLFTIVLRAREAMTPGTLPYRFRRWVTGEVLPAIRKTGRYEVPGLPAPTSDALDPRIGDIPLAVMSFNLRRVSVADSLFGKAAARALWHDLKLGSVRVTPSSDEEARDCLAHLLSAKAYGSANLLLPEIEAALDGDETARGGLMAAGIRIPGEGGADGFIVASGAPHLLKVFADTPWRDRIYMRVLKRLPGAYAVGPFKMGGPAMRGVFIPADNLDLGAAARRDVA